MQLREVGINLDGSDTNAHSHDVSKPSNWCCFNSRNDDKWSSYRHGASHNGNLMSELTSDDGLP